MVDRLAFRKLAPHLYLQAIPARVSDADLAAFLAELQRASPTLDRPHAWIADFAGIESTTATQRRMFAEHQVAVEAVDRAHNAGAAIVIPNAMVRGVVTAVYWIKPPVYPYQFVQRLDEALVWVTDSLKRRGVSLDAPSLRNDLLR